MDLLRERFDKAYDSYKEKLFEKTKENPKKAHEMMVKFSKTLTRLRLARLILNNHLNSKIL